MILVTGANGFVGSHLVPRLVRECGQPVAALARPGADTRRLEALGVTVRRGNVTDFASLQAALQGVETVFHLVAVPISRGRQTFQAVNVEGTRNVAAAAQKARVKRLVQLSALGASDEPRYPYTYSKWLGEQAVREAGVPFTIFRPSVMFGEGDGFFAAFAGLSSFVPFIFPSPGHGDVRFQPLWVEDLVTAAIKCLNQTNTIGETIELGGPEHLSYDQMLQAVLAARGKKRKIVHVPLPLMRIPVLLFSLLPYPPVDSGQLDLLNVRNTTDLDAVERWFGFKPKPLREGLDYLKHFDSRQWLRGRLEAP